ncbi:N-acyl-D-amino-acid deacylase family protein [Gudongella sp. DL1XJH-153]|uniref:N-acyl-D-amino-acid deacylase family protein n=1 Tax=Gudongella sp. DL1XJH-153 TaxID=3409804 RepID=UPI003BB51C74
MYDYILKNGILVDGLRNSPIKATLYIKNGRIKRISEECDEEGTEVIDCEGKVIAPGFIDLHTHSDACALNTKKAESMINQGVTMQIGGNCGISLIPSTPERKDEIKAFFTRTIEIVPEDKNIELNSMEDYVKLSKINNLAINSGLLVGHGTLRAAVIGFEDKKATEEEMEEMKKLLENELKNGAFGMSLGLIYPPSSYGDIEEFAELSKVIKNNDGIISVHMRNEADGVFDSVDEMIQVAEKSGVHLHISHLKLMGKPQWGKSKQLLNKIEEARQRGCKITCDQYPYEATSTGLAALVPGWALNGGNSKMLENLELKEEKLINEMTEIMNKRGGPEAVVVTSTHGYLPEMDGKSLNEIAKIYETTPIDAAIRVLLECKGEVSAIYFSMHLDDVYNIMKSMDIAVGSDGIDFGYDLNYNPHPRNFGTFPRFFQTVREQKLMPLEDAVYKVSGLPAKIINQTDRGVLRVDNIADVTVFDYDEIEDMSSFIKSPVKPKGIEYVFVNGKPALFDGKQTEYREGKVLLSKAGEE